MFLFSKNEELTVDILNKMLNKYATTYLPVSEHYKDYFDGRQAILSKSYEDPSKPCSRTVTNFCKNIVNSYLGYMAAPGTITYQSDEDITQLMEVLDYNDHNAEDCNFLRDALIYGVANELMYVDNDSKARFTTVSPLSSFGIFDDCLNGELLYFVRWYKQSDWDDSQNYFLDVYTDSEIRHYTMLGLNGPLEFLSAEPHYFNQCPANVFYLEDEESIFKCIEGLQDSYNETLNNQVDDISSFTNAYMVMTGSFDPDTIDTNAMRTNRLIMMPEGTQVSWLTKDLQDTQVKENLDRLQASIYRIAQCPDFSSESFVGGVSSGIAIKYRLTGMETRAATIEASMKKALQRRIEILCGFVSLKLGEEVYRDIKINFERNIPEDLSTLAAAVSQLNGIVSDETLLSTLPFVDNPKEEAERVKEQKESSLKLYDFTQTVNEEQDET